MKSLYSKFAITTILIMLASGIISFLISNIYYQSYLKNQNDLKMTNIALEISEYIHLQNQINLKEYFEHLGSIGYQILIIDGNENRKFFGAAFRVENLSKVPVQRVLNGEVFHGIADFPHKTFVTGFFANELRNTVGVPFEYKNERYALFLRPDIKLLFNEMHRMFGWLVVGMVVFSMLLVLISTKYLIKPISKLNKATSLIAEGNFGIKLNINRQDEIGELASSFQTMAGRLEQANDIRKEFISNISHDIQSPLSNIKGYLKLLKSAELTAQHKEYFDVVDSEVNRLSYLTKQLLLLSSLDSQRDLLDKKEFNLSEQLKTVIRQYQWILSEKGLMISYSFPEVYVHGDPSLLYSVWENLLTNAIKYSEENSEIDITLNDQPDSIEVSFKDHGIGLNSKELERIYDRFYRADTSRTRTIEGTGLGLSIVQSILDMHDGEIKVGSKKGEGSMFTVKLPKG
ncbi:HAMP domain-containing sensor histidine kinase [Bacillus sp. DTU_2020_1000418_1_SI_GHA_SEK_038]|uniref:HAMP domain-containing sensor histidine kinase n=1 Tax=Bacillus sp. DTU_2020_1000418_1_SI_GHA_SEK_038 TaxID=3077585 RepID=UPI0028E28CCB|nr:HAMP domain-containing sensor histidine kinase [Bacillus sp. DTU_2020_1000418_1_SI_GHA_SEK_038]WNS73836.1 HAMP domain-containing sensor histidine kinase [Bacillus sp. DTU_2020_1000418_1_SI_GHA_SEK_038]